MLSNTVSTAISALVLVLGVRVDHFVDDVELKKRVMGSFERPFKCLMLREISGKIAELPPVSLKMLIPADLALSS